MSESPRFAYVLRLADTALVLGHRLSQWSARAPTLEEDIALSNLALDLIGQSRLFYQYAGGVEGLGRDEDSLAYLRDETDYRNLLIAEQPNGDFAATMARAKRTARSGHRRRGLVRYLLLTSPLHAFAVAGTAENAAVPAR